MQLELVLLPGLQSVRSPKFHVCFHRFNRAFPRGLFLLSVFYMTKTATHSFSIVYCFLIIFFVCCWLSVVVFFFPFVALIHGRHSLAIMPVMAIAGIYAGKRYPGLSDKEAEEYWATLPPPKESKQ